jgi:hypothetical protein
MRRTLFGWVACLLAVGCGNDASQPSTSVPNWSLQPVALVQPEPTPFGRISDVRLGEDGSLFVLDGLSRTIRVFNPDGVAVREFGGGGQGPGEFEQPGKLLWGPAGNLWVLDLRNGRLTVFTPGGELQGTYRPMNLPLLYPFALGFSDPTTLRWVGITSPDPANPEAAWVETAVAESAIRPVDQIALPFVKWPLLFEHRDAEISLVLPVPFSGEPLFAVDPQGRLWYNYSGEATLVRLSRTGDIELTVGVDITPAPVTAADRAEAMSEEAFAEVRNRLGEVGVSGMESLIPDHKPYYDTFFFDDEGSLWVVRSEVETSDPGERSVDIYNSDGTPRAFTSLGVAAVPAPRVRNRVLAGVVRDELGVESVAVFRVVR